MTKESQHTQVAISVLIPVYNVEKYLARCLDSVLSQNIKNIEIICVNDASPDNSSLILQRYATEHDCIKIISKEHNEGLMMARKTAYDSAKGKFILFLDSDDYLLPDSLLPLYEKSIQSDADIVASDFLYINGKGESKLKRRTEELNDSPESYLKGILLSTPCMIWGLLINRRLFENAQYKSFMNQTLCEDRILLVQLLLNSKKIASYDSPVVAYTYNSGAITRNRWPEKKLRENLFGLSWCKDFYIQHGLFEKLAVAKYLRDISFIIECGYPINIIREYIDASSGLLNFNNLKRYLGLRLAFHTKMCMNFTFYRKIANSSRMFLRRLLGK